MAYKAILAHKLRSILSVVGITIGIYCIIAVYALVHSMEKNINDSFSSMGTDVLFVDKWPWDQIGEDYPWWKFMSRPQVIPEEADFLEKHIQRNFVSAIAFTFGQNTKAEYRRESLTGIRLVAASFDYNQIQKVEIESGRYFTVQETNAGRPVAIIGYTVAQELYGGSDPVGKSIRVAGRNCTVIGVCTKAGKSVLNNSTDDRIFVPARYAMSFLNYRRGEKGCQIMVKAASGVSLNDLTFEVEQVMRRFRRIKPGAENTFAVNQMSMITGVVSSLFGQVQNIGLVIGGFSMLVGCFGVANIMFVSVKERTSEIGIQKALGARKTFILAQFLSESVLLCILGGLLGMLLVWGTFGAINYLLEHQMDSAFRVYLGTSDLALGFWVSVIVGIVAGFVPASAAAKLNPVDAIRSK